MTLTQREISEGRKLRQRLSTQIEFINSVLRYDKDPELETALALAVEARQEIDAQLRSLGYIIN